MEFYPPSEDTFLLEDALEREMGGTDAGVIVEVGSGSGYISAFLRRKFQNAFVVSTDINSRAAAQTASETARGAGEKKNLLENGDVFRMNLLDHVRSSVVDAVVFNPPYVPSERRFLEGSGIDRSWAGGEHGREIIDEFIGKLGHVKAFFLLLSEANMPGQLVESLGKRFRCSVAAHRKVEGESLLVLKGVRVEEAEGGDMRLQ